MSILVKRQILSLTVLMYKKAFLENLLIQYFSTEWIHAINKMVNYYDVLRSLSQPE